MKKSLAVVAADAKHGYRAVNAIEREAFPVSEAHKAIINRVKALLDSEATKKDKAAYSAAAAPRGRGRGRGFSGFSGGRGRGFQPPKGRYNDNNNYNKRQPGGMQCVICGKPGHLANSCYSKFDKNDPKGPAGKSAGAGN